MIIKNIKADGYKNLKAVDIQPDPKINVLYGDNAQGKTNLVEALWILTGAKSFRGTKERDMVGFEREKAEVTVDFQDDVRDQKIELVLTKNSRERRILLNGLKQKSFSGLFGQLKCVVFTPEDLELSKGSPEIRRDFLDLCISQIKPSYSATVAKYENILLQRNTLLKNIFSGISQDDELDVWDVQLARLGAYISVLRYAYAQKLWQFAGGVYNDLCAGKEKLIIKYSSSIYDELDGRTDYAGEMAKEYLEKLNESRRDDIRFGFTQRGIHRDDVYVHIDGLLAKDFGSQGQNRSAALSMKLGQAYILHEETEDMPVMLLDDVLSELDSKRREFILSKLKDMQVFITCCEPVKKLSGRYFEVSGGNIRKVR